MASGIQIWSVDVIAAMILNSSTAIMVEMGAEVDEAGVS
jgi:hypothetical protein